MASPVQSGPSLLVVRTQPGGENHKAREAPPSMRQESRQLPKVGQMQAYTGEGGRREPLGPSKRQESRPLPSAQQTQACTGNEWAWGMDGEEGDKRHDNVQRGRAARSLRAGYLCLPR